MTVCPRSCGACCDPVLLSAPLRGLTVWTDLAGVPDPATDDGWRSWTALGWTDDSRDWVVGKYRDAGPNPRFAAAHWTEIGAVELADVGGTRTMYEVRCDQFDPDSRRCLAYDRRPPICADYPWYGAQPDPARSLDSVCVFHGDVPGRRVLPLVAVNGRPTN